MHPVSELDPLRAVHDAARRLHLLEDEVAACRAQRDAAIERAYAAGNSIGVIASAADLTNARISILLGSPHGSPGRPRKPVTPLW